MASDLIGWETPDELRAAALQYERELARREEDDLWEEVEAAAPNDFIGWFSEEAEAERQRFWEAELARHEAAEAEIAALLAEIGDEEPDDSAWDGLVDLGNGIRG